MQLPKTSNKKHTFFYIFISILVLFILFAGIFLYRKTKTNGSETLIKPLSYNDPNVSSGAIPNKVISPITGQIYKGVEAKDWWLRRPLAVMVNNYVDARPQSGLQDADIIYEIVAEGGITRFLSFFLTTTPEKIGPVRSTREYYLVLVKELGDAMIMHIGWSPQALEAIETWPVRSLQRGGATFWRDTTRDVAIEHTAYVNGVELYQRGLELGWEGKHPLDVWKFKDTDKYTSAPLASKISIDFWYKGDYSANWSYDKENNAYLRFTGFDSAGNPIAHVDNETKAQLSYTNVVVQFAEEVAIDGDDKNRLAYELIGSGEALIFMDGRVIQGTWNKTERDVRTRFYDMQGKEMEFNRGKFWVSVVPTRNKDQVVFN